MSFQTKFDFNAKPRTDKKSAAPNLLALSLLSFMPNGS